METLAREKERGWEYGENLQYICNSNKTKKELSVKRNEDQIKFFKLKTELYNFKQNITATYPYMASL